MHSEQRWIFIIFYQVFSIWGFSCASKTNVSQFNLCQMCPAVTGWLLPNLSFKRDNYQLSLKFPVRNFRFQTSCHIFPCSWKGKITILGWNHHKTNFRGARFCDCLCQQRCHASFSTVKKKSLVVQRLLETHFGFPHLPLLRWLPVKNGFL